jgi:hypothetical protein
MLAVKKLEFIAENYFAYRRQSPYPHRPSDSYGDYLGRDKSRPWIARLIGLDETYGFKREFVRGQIDYSQSNQIGSRGVYIYYPLKEGLYEVNERETWTRVRRYFIRVQGMTITEIAREEALACLQNNTSV